MKRNDSRYLQHIRDAITKIESYLENLDEESFRADTLRQDGVIRRLEIIGEAVKQLSSALRLRHPQIPWSDIAGMRDRLIHHYFGVDLTEVWLTATRDLPQLKEAVDQALKDAIESSHPGQGSLFQQDER